MPTSNSIWSEYDIWWEGYIPETTPYYMVITGDTIINDISYHKIVQSWGDTIIDMTIDHFRGCFREDTNKSVYFLPNDSINEVLIYDFSKNIGDTIYVIGGSLQWKSGYDTLPHIINEIDSVFINDNYRKRFNFNESGLIFDFDWIEGIGSMGGILNSFNPNTIGGRWEFNCLTQDGDFVFQNPVTYIADCFVMTGFVSQNNPEISISIYPNPSQGIFQIKGGWSNPVIVGLYSVFGGLLLEKQLDKTECIIDLTNFTSGMYVIRVTIPETKHVYYNKLILKK